jgi:H+/Na+-translocating ferredoxin:NAD+ oxidoreductase subunit E
MTAPPAYNPGMDARSIVANGLAAQNPGLVQLLGLCPLLAVSTTVAYGLGLGLATIAVLLISNAFAALVGRWLLPEIRIAVFVVVIAAAVTAVELALAAWMPAIHAGLGIFLPLIVTNCLVLARAESFASRNPLGFAMLDALAMGAGFLLVLLALGASRELLGHGTLGAGLDELLGPAWSGARIELFAERHGLLLALLPPGAFILLGLMLATSRVASLRRATRRAAAPAPGDTAREAR